MAALPNNIWIVNEAEAKFTMTPAIVASGAVGTIATGTPTKGADAAAASWTGAVVPMVDGDGSTSQRFTGLAKNTSTDTASVAGVVTVWLPLPGLVYASKSKAASSANTAALVAGLFGKRVVFDLTSTTWSVDAAAADAVANCVTIIGGDYNTNTLYFTYSPKGTMLGFAISA
jgi:hypothetical protein